MLGSSLLDRIHELTRWHFLVAVAVLALLASLVEVVLRHRRNPSRRRLMEAQLHALRNSLVLAVGLRVVVRVAEWLHVPAWLAIGAGFGAGLAWMNTSLRVARVLVFQWLFARSEREGVPVLLVDIFTVVASVVIFGVLLHAVFLIEVTSLLATSAVLSVVLGLALQDTLGQLLAGISLQLDRPFRLGDWVEVDSGVKRVGGQVLEVSWRATLLLAIGEELITIPNKTMAQGLVLNFSGKLLTQAALETDGIAREPAPVPLVIESTESWIAVKMINFVTDYGAQYTIGDAFQTRALELLAEHGIELATQRLELQSHERMRTSTRASGAALRTRRT
jgi:small-conductance mechanosensitive channel